MREAVGALRLDMPTESDADGLLSILPPRRWASKWIKLFFVGTLTLHCLLVSSFASPLPRFFSSSGRVGVA